MLFHDSPLPAPNPRKVRMFAHEKGVQLPSREVSIVKGEHKAAGYVALNPVGQTPALTLDDGETIAESIAICRYLEALHPDPPLFGTTAAEIARTDMWLRRVELRLGVPVGMIWVHTHPFTARVVPKQFTEFGESNRPAVTRALDLFDAQLADHEWLAGGGYSIADIVLLCTIDFASFIGLTPIADHPNVRHWHARASSRPSAAA